MKAEILAIGSELVSGQRLDTNSQWLSRRLAEIGIPVHFHTTLGDDLGENLDALRVAIGRSSLVLTTGGLGPTQDDLTRDALAALANVPLVEDAPSLSAIEAMFARRNRPMAPRNRVQALIPRGAEALPNRVGTAPGIRMTVGAAEILCLPGVPSEMMVMYDEQILPRLVTRLATGHVIVHRVIHLFGRGESEVEAAALDLTVRGRRPEVGITAHDATISFRITCDGPTEADALREIEPTLESIRHRFGELVVGEAEGKDVADALVHELARTGTTLAVAESCTGGLVSAELTRIPGVSAHFLGGVVSYSNDVKASILGVPSDLIAGRGAVSPEVAEAMATGVRERLRADIGLSITGIAGPGGGSAEKPVGLVYLGLASPAGVEVRRLDLGPEQPRDVIRSRAAKNAMNWVRLSLRQRPGYP
jgi:nicotinamide-nucleotide amidase